MRGKGIRTGNSIDIFRITGNAPTSSEITGRITPAHAGKSRPLNLSTTGTKDHPRTCGEKMANMTLNRQKRGSPPHMRGKVFEI